MHVHRHLRHKSTGKGTGAGTDTGMDTGHRREPDSVPHRWDGPAEAARGRCCPGRVAPWLEVEGGEGAPDAEPPAFMEDVEMCSTTIACTGCVWCGVWGVGCVCCVCCVCMVWGVWVCVCGFLMASKVRFLPTLGTTRY